MQLVVPDILAEAKGLSLGLCIVGLVVGLALLCLGWWSHRFWAGLIAAVVAGVLGLAEGPALRAQPLVAAVLLAIAAGMMALALVRLVAFGAGGLTLLAAAQAIGPPGDGAAIFFLAGGLMGLLLFRLTIMLLTSLGGSLLIVYSVLCLLDRLHRMEAAEWAEKHRVLLNWICGGVVAGGLCLQLYLNRARATPKPAKGRKSPPREEDEEKPDAEARFPWVPGLFRKAG